jgi:glycerol-3-phosphate dehydrogenase (NAD(P)+)
MASYNSVAVIGAGAWGTALASVAARAGRDVVLYARNDGAATHMTATRENPRLSGVSLDARIIITSDIAVAARADIILLAVPAQHFHHILPRRHRWSPAPRASSAAATNS